MCIWFIGLALPQESRPRTLSLPYSLDVDRMICWKFHLCQMLSIREYKLTQFVQEIGIFKLQRQTFSTYYTILIFFYDSFTYEIFPFITISWWECVSNVKMYSLSLLWLTLYLKGNIFFSKNRFYYSGKHSFLFTMNLNEKRALWW